MEGQDINASFLTKKNKKTKQGKTIKQSNNLIILGAAESGIGAALLAKKKGFKVLVSDNGTIQDRYKKELLEAEIDFEEGGHSMIDILKADGIVKSPGIPNHIKLIQDIRKAGIPIWSEIEFASRYTESPIIAITGSNGKTTTTALTHHLLKTAGLKVGVGGNIGNSFSSLVTEDKHDYYVIEVSSFQLDDIDTFKPYIAILTNITPDHLDRYNYQFEHYIAAKYRIIENQTTTDHFIYNIDDEATNSYLKKYTTLAQGHPFSLKSKTENGASYAQEQMHLAASTPPFSIHRKTLTLKGQHNLYNAMSAALVAQILGIDKTTIEQGLQTFGSLEHRLEPVATINGIAFINDSKATNIDSVWYALDAMTQPIVWVVGGQDKGNDYAQLMPLVKSKVKAIVCLGLDNSKIIEAFAPLDYPIIETRTAANAVAAAFKMAEKNDLVLLSPACSSFDLFTNYKERGKLFKQAVEHLKIDFE